MRGTALGPLFSPPKDGGRIHPSPSHPEAKSAPLSGLRLLRMAGNTLVLTCAGPAPRIGEALVLRDREKELFLQVVGVELVGEERRVVAKAWNWDGGLPSPGARVFRAKFPLRPSHPPKIHLGRTLDGQEFAPGGRALEKVNLIVGAKGSGKSHLAKVILHGLIGARATCLILDVNREYGGLPGVEVLEVGRAFRLGVRELGIGAMCTFLEAFGTPATSLLYFENRLSKLLLERDGFIGIRDLIELAEEGEYCPTRSPGADSVNRTIRSRLEALRLTGMVAESPLEASSFDRVWQGIKGGGAIAFDISGLSTPARAGFAHALLGFLFRLVEEEGPLPFVFFEEAHLYVSPQGVDALVTRARHTGITSFFITNTPTALPEGVLRAADNLFLFRLPLEEDVRWVAKSGFVDEASLASLVRALPRHACLALGEVSGGYPVVLWPDPLRGLDTRGRTRYFFR